MSQPRYEKLQWTLEILTRSGIKEFEISKVEKVGKDTHFAVRGRVTTSLPVLYVLRVGEANRHVRVALMAQVSSLTQTSGSEVRLPQAGAFLVSDTPGAIHVLATERILTREELARLLDGREPPPDPTTRDSTMK